MFLDAKILTHFRPKIQHRIKIHTKYYCVGLTEEDKVEAERDTEGSEEKWMEVFVENV